MRGEHIWGVFLGVWCVGSSPHARGTHNAKIDANAKKGIIPACAGNTLWNR